MIKKSLWILLVLCLFFASCEETKESGKFDNWHARNEGFIDSLRTVFENKTDPRLDTIRPLTNPGIMVYYKDITPEGDDIKNEIPLYTSSVSVFFRGSYITGEIFEENFKGKDPTSFDSPLTKTVSEVVWLEALQHMKVGQRWLIYIPWQMQPNNTGKSDYIPAGSSVKVPGYTTLVYDLQLLSIVEK